MQTINWSKAIQAKKDQEKKDAIHRAEAIKEIKLTTLEGLDARDINMFAAEAGIEPNDVRRLMVHTDDLNQDFKNELDSFEDDETDSIFDYY